MATVLVRIQALDPKKNWERGWGKDAKEKVIVKIRSRFSDP